MNVQEESPKVAFHGLVAAKAEKKKEGGGGHPQKHCAYNKSSRGVCEFVHVPGKVGAEVKNAAFLR